MLASTTARCHPRVASAIRRSRPRASKDSSKGLFASVKDRISTIRKASAEVAGVVRRREGEGQDELLIRWADGAEDSWEPINNISPDVVREWDNKWWAACRDGDEDSVVTMLAVEDRDATVADADQRTPLHYLCGRGAERGVAAVLNYGANVDAGDKAGYTPLHIAAGYRNPSTVAQLLDAGADAELSDADGRTPIELSRALRAAQPKDMSGLATRMSLCDIERMMNAYLWEVEPVEAVLERREDNAKVEYLVRWAADPPTEQWLPAAQLHADLVAQFDAGFESASVERIAAKRMSVTGDGVEFKVQWADGTSSWEPEANLDPDDINAFLAASDGD